MKCQKSKISEQVKNRRRFSTKAQSISINTIVVAAIALVVMVLIVMIFTGNIGNWRRGADSCESNGGECIDVDDVDELCSGTYDRVRSYPCYVGTEKDDDLACCVRT